MKSVLLIGSGGREHAMAEAFKRCSRGVKLFAFGKTKNPGIAALSEAYEIADVNDFDRLKSFALKVKPDFVISGPEDPIAHGLTDFLSSLSLPCVAPRQGGAQLESSKSFTRDLLKKYNIPGNPDFRVFSEVSPEIHHFLETLQNGYVVKADGLAGGKGVKVSEDHLKTIDEGIAYAEECIQKFGKVVIEEKLVGQEFSLMAFSDGVTTVEMPAIQDHKRAFENDQGPNTGGMGSYSDADHLLPFLKTEDVDEARMIMKMAIEALKKETGILYKGILYGGFMAGRDGVQLIEFNVRLGDPEALNVLPILETDLTDICEAILNNDLKNLPVSFAERATVCKYIVPEGYPDNPKKNVPITISNVSEVRTYFSSVEKKGEELFLKGSRAIAFTGIAETIAEAEKIAEQAASNVIGPVFHRKDIGTKTLIEKRVKMMAELRNP